MWSNNHINKEFRQKATHCRGADFLWGQIERDIGQLEQYKDYFFGVLRTAILYFLEMEIL